MLARVRPSEGEAAVVAFLTYSVELARACAKEDLAAPGPVYLTRPARSSWITRPSPGP